MYFCRILAACISRRHLHARGNKQLFLDLAPSWPLLAWAPNRVASPKRRERVGKVRQKDETRLELAGPGKGSPSGARKCSKKPLAPRGRGDAFMQPTAWTRRAWPRAPKCNLLPALFRCTRLEANGHARLPHAAAAAAGGARGGGPLMQPCNRAHQIVSQIAHPGSSRSAPLLLLPFIFIPSLPRAALIPTRAALSLSLPAGLPLALHSSHIVVSLSLCSLVSIRHPLPPPFSTLLDTQGLSAPPSPRVPNLWQLTARCTASAPSSAPGPWHHRNKRPTPLDIQSDTAPAPSHPTRPI
ncbi:hypothetical protein L1887_47899 [Cichorium endivia]|nr:hypothetical protein L1887_47899 [Cichorium endivia]